MVARKYISVAALALAGSAVVSAEANAGWRRVCRYMGPQIGLACNMMWVADEMDQYRMRHQPEIDETNRRMRQRWDQQGPGNWPCHQVRHPYYCP